MKVILQGDGEPALQHLLNRAKAELTKKEFATEESDQIRSSPVDSHQSNGGTGKAISTIRAQMLAYKIQIEKNAKMKLDKDSDILTWFPRHAAWQYTRFHKRRDTGLTGYEKLRLVRYAQPILMPGEAVLRRRPCAVVNKLQSQWLEGVWLCRDSKTDEHLIGTPQGATRSRALKRKTEERRWDPMLIAAMQ